MQRLKEVIKFLMELQNALHYRLSTTSLFIIKCIIVTMCIKSVISVLPFPRYEMLEDHTKINKVTGEVDFKHTLWSKI